MALTIYEHIFPVELNETLKRRNVDLLGTHDKKANRFGARLTRDGADVDVTGCKVYGYFIRPDEDTILIEGTVEGNLVYVDVPADCYLYDGAFVLSIKISKAEDDFEQTVLIFDGILAKTATDEVIVGEYKILSVSEIAAMMAEVDNAVKAANETAQELREAAENGDFNGNDGFSPSANVEQTSEGAVITVVDANGTTTATVKNGADGVGIAGVSVTRSPDEYGYYYITVELTNGQVQAIPYKDGKDGKDGSPGKDGSDANVTTENISNALGYTPADAEEVRQLSEEIEELKQSGTGGIVTETDPTVPAWAKQPNKPTYTAEDVGAATTEQVNAKYSKPSDGIPASDLAKTVQTSLNKADTALQSHQSLAEYAKKTEVTAEVNALKETLVNQMTLGYHTDGLMYLFVDGVPVGNGVEFIGGASGDVVGYVDSENNIVLTGVLADGTYTVKYEDEDGEVQDIGQIVLADAPTSGTINPNLQDGKINSSGGIEASTTYMYSDMITMEPGKKYTVALINEGVAADVKIAYYNASGGYVSVSEAIVSSSTDDLNIGEWDIPEVSGATQFRLRMLAYQVTDTGSGDTAWNRSKALARANTVINWSVV